MKTTIKKEATEDYLMSQLEICKTKEDLILAFWFYWVESVVTNSIDFQKVLSNSSVNKWFLVELRKEEIEFKNLIAKSPRIKGREKDWIYCKCISKLMCRFPKALLESVKKKEQKRPHLKVLIMPIEKQN
ncbi:hypothetical protein NJT12_03460 [Flavobacterium sp. AC]|uniref:Uncharacterized protein n=1 Tax=Flavobacterium azizsancarii TaxID=2961580 RepID=A0ABT4W818_9FLAO|nr:hypothetical protein [Flavobacterium azizsancarii]MDA6068669.1 hypothetical protein [Flavobacterium azizsancarii]